MEITDLKTGKAIPAEVFVAILPASQLTYAEASENQTQESFMRSNERAIRYFGGVPAALVPDNLKSGVIRPDIYEPDLNPLFADFAEYYRTAVIPARARKPKDKAHVENAVKIIYMRVFAPLRNKTFHSLCELNQAIKERLEVHNNKKLTKMTVSRRELFEEVERSELKALPIAPYPLKYFQDDTLVEFNYHVYLKDDKHYYSVPYQNAGIKVKTIYTSRMVEIFKDDVRIAIYQRNRKPYGYTTLKEHMPPDHQLVNGWNPDRFISWAEKKGGSVKEFIQLMLDQRAHPQQAFKACLGVLKLGSSYEDEAMQAVCKKAIEVNNISYRFIANSLKNKTYKIDDQDAEDMTIPHHENIRGKENYK